MDRNIVVSVVGVLTIILAIVICYIFNRWYVGQYICCPSEPINTINQTPLVAEQV